jgi:hypothetical protein
MILGNLRRASFCGLPVISILPQPLLEGEPIAGWAVSFCGPWGYNYHAGAFAYLMPLGFFRKFGKYEPYKTQYTILLLAIQAPYF